jgi:Lrp/AsnC family transcriptional regulator for asnA, asnC and gidA
VAQQCGVSRAAIHQRVQKMIDDGIITGSGYHVDPIKIGYSTCTYVGLTLEKGSMYRDVVTELDRIPEVVESHFTTGRFTMMIKLYAKDNAHLMDLINGAIQVIPGVVATETLISLDESINKAVPILEELV